MGSLSRTPFGPLRGEGGEDGGWTSFAQTDAARRNVVLSEIDAALAPLRVGGTLASLPVARRETIERTLARAASFLSLHNVQRALDFARALQLDVADAAESVRVQSPPTSPSESCDETVTSARSSVASLVLLGVASALFGALAVGALRRCVCVRGARV